MSSSLENTSIFLVFTATDASIPDLKQKEEDSHLWEDIYELKKKKKKQKLLRKKHYYWTQRKDLRNQNSAM